jgi:hypothetical protein
MTLDEIVARLQELRQKVGGQARVLHEGECNDFTVHYQVTGAVLDVDGDVVLVSEIL